jgi:hypothetical protein
MAPPAHRPCSYAHRGSLIHHHGRCAGSCSTQSHALGTTRLRAAASTAVAAARAMMQHQRTQTMRYALCACYKL